MSFSGDNDIHRTGDQVEEKFSPKVAYTFGATQNVRSTYIAHDPFFFMDVEDSILDDEECFELHDSIESTDSNYFSSFGESGHLLDILENFDSNIESYNPAASVKSSSTELEEIFTIMRKSRYAGTLLDLALSENIRIEANTHIFSAEYNKDTQIILYNPSLNQVDTLKVLMMALRQFWQAKSGALIHPLSFYPDHAIFVYRAQNADIAASLLRVGWELYLSGYEDLWTDLESTSLKDMAHSFAREAALDFRTLNNGKAIYAAFETWFLSDRSRICDNQLVQRLLAGNYKGPTIENEDMSIMVLTQFTGALGEMPYGKNYLGGSAQSIVSDPVFMDIRERSNANFLWFVKFEKTFREMEQELQSGEDLPEGTTISSSGKSRPTDPSRKDTHDTKTANEGKILCFPREFKQQEEESAICSNDAPAIFTANGTRRPSADIIPFDIAARPFNTTF